MHIYYLHKNVPWEYNVSLQPNTFQIEIMRIIIMPYAHHDLRLPMKFILWHYAHDTTTKRYYVFFIWPHTFDITCMYASVFVFVVLWGQKVSWYKNINRRLLLPFITITNVGIYVFCRLCNSLRDRTNMVIFCKLIMTSMQNMV